MPVAGDPIYGKGVGPTLLHAWKLRLERAGKEAIVAEAPLPGRFAALGFALPESIDAGA
jgi:tRNA pseudouridine32 synthase/23S rRNA pseudouridine746 synthase